MFLPKGLLYSTLLSPYFFWRQIQLKRPTAWKSFFFILLLYDVIHVWMGVDFMSFLKSNLLFIATYFFVVSAFHFVNTYSPMAKLFRQVLVFNCFMVLVAIPFFFMDPHYQDWFWWVNRAAPGATEFPRLKLFTYEASYYALLFVPILYYYVFKLLFHDVHQYRWPLLICILVPVVFSMSFGVIGATLITAVAMCVLFRKQLLRYKKPFQILLTSILILGLGFGILLYLFPNSALVIRFFNVFKGVDTSANGRISDSLSLGWRIAQLKSIWFGAGLGQVKIQIVEVVKLYYNYWGQFARYDIPNAIGETMAIFGLSGVAGRIALQIYFFRKTRVASNYYRLALFIFVFVYQFTGSFITNVAEYMIWILAFSEIFPQFNAKDL